MKIKIMIQLAIQRVILVLTIGRKKFPRYFKGYLNFSAIFNGYFVLIYSKIPRRIPKVIQRNPGWETLVEFVQRLGYGLDNGKIVALTTGQVRGPPLQKSFQTVIEARLVSNPMATGAPFLGTIWPEIEAGHFSPANIRLYVIVFMT